jgi:hypothetical protein
LRDDLALPRKTLTIQQIVAQLEDTVPSIAAVTEPVPIARLRSPSSGDDWSANDVLAHLRACADVWGNAILAILRADHPILQGTDPRTWMRQTDYVDWEFDPSFRRFAAQRRKLLRAIKPIPATDWSRTATVFAWGQRYEQSILYFGDRLARHERAHLKQINRIVAALPQRST